jgi:hypothetical protein
MVAFSCHSEIRKKGEKVPGYFSVCGAQGKITRYLLRLLVIEFELIAVFENEIGSQGDGSARGSP